MNKRIISVSLAIAILFGCLPSHVYATENNTEVITEEQNNSVIMLNYLTTITNEINASNNSKLYLEEVYSSILNNTDPKIDTSTQDYLNDLIKTLQQYRMIGKKREHLEYLYEQKKAQSLRSAIPNPLGLLSAVQAGSLKKIIAAGIYMATDSILSYQASNSEAELEYLKEGWALDEEQQKNLDNSNLRLFNYMIDIAREYNIPTNMTLNNEDVSYFVKCENNNNLHQRLQSLETNKSKYEKFGSYWILLAKTYYEMADKGYDSTGYKKCLDAVKEYEALKIHIFRKDHDYANVLPLAISSANETKSQGEYVKYADKCAQAIMDNTNSDEWSLRYFVAQTYVDLYSKTKKDDYLKKAYEIAVNNVNELVNEQKKKNAAYNAPIKEEKEPKGATKQDKEDIKQYNKMIKEQRKTELPPVYEPLVLNCDLLFALAGQIDISASEKTRIEGILHDNGEVLFETAPLDNLYRFEKSNNDFTNIGFDGEELTIPASYLSADSSIKVTVTDNDGTVYEDWEIDEVDRGKSNDVNEFIATYESPTIGKHEYTPESMIKIEINPSVNSNCENIVVNYKVDNFKTYAFFFDNYDFVKVEK